VRPGALVRVRTLGGSVEGITQRAFGEAELRAQAPALLFLKQVEPQLHVVSGMAEGHLTLTPDAQGEMRLRVAPSRALAYAEPGSMSALEGASVAEARKLLSEAAQSTARGVHAR
jgi:hypothetical protein